MVLAWWRGIAGGEEDSRVIVWVLGSEIYMCPWTARLPSAVVGRRMAFTACGGEEAGWSTGAVDLRIAKERKGGVYGRSTKKLDRLER